jgi:hypothetical protein
MQLPGARMNGRWISSRSLKSSTNNLTIIKHLLM